MAEDREPMLWTDEALDAERLLREFPAAAKHSARYLRERNRRLYDSIVLALSYGIPVSEIESKVGVGENTIRSVAFHEASAVEDGKQALKSNLRKFIHGAASVLAESYDQIPLEKLPVAVGIMIDKLLLLEGSATQIVRHEQGASVEDVARLIEAAQRRAHGTVVEMAPETGSEAEKDSPKGAGGPSGPADAVAAELTDSDGLAGGNELPSGWKAPAESSQIVDNERSEGEVYRPLYQSGTNGDGTEGGAKGGGGGSKTAGGEE